MQKDHQDPQPEPERVSPWAHIDDELRAEAREYAHLRIELGLIFRGAQQESYEFWLELDKWADAQEAPA